MVVLTKYLRRPPQFASRGRRPRAQCAPVDRGPMRCRRGFFDIAGRRHRPACVRPAADRPAGRFGPWRSASPRTASWMVSCAPERARDCRLARGGEDAGHRTAHRIFKEAVRTRRCRRLPPSSSDTFLKGIRRQSLTRAPVAAATGEGAWQIGMGDQRSHRPTRPIARHHIHSRGEARRLVTSLMNSSSEAEVNSDGLETTCIRPLRPAPALSRQHQRRVPRMINAHPPTGSRRR